MTFSSGAVDGPDGVAVVCRDNASVTVRLCERSSEDGWCVHYSVEVRGPGLGARIEDVVGWVGDSQGLGGFLEALAGDFAGWEGERLWTTGDRDLAVSAVHRSGGHVGLTWTLRPWRSTAAGWSASVTTWLEAGAQMSSLASDIRHFVDGPAD
ncbi:DUF6228 family protein [Streptomyces sp. NPDC097619]|uniref:DUF6228 family protein n=1 Tax=Streptomyces sp. NPDC097619 TaxID=3157228 RepID=UPI00331BD5BB